LFGLGRKLLRVPNNAAVDAGFAWSGPTTATLRTKKNIRDSFFFFNFSAEIGRTWGTGAE